MSWLDQLKEKDGFISMTGASEDQIQSSEAKLETTFAADYHSYVSEMGVATFKGHELTGICSSKRLNVTLVTEEERKVYEQIPPTWYVIEQTNIDGIVIWQDSKGVIYQVSPNTKPKAIAKSLAEYCGILV